MYCPFCGARIRDQARYCSKCGKQIPERRRRTPTQRRKQVPTKVQTPTDIDSASMEARLARIEGKEVPKKPKTPSLKELNEIEETIGQLEGIISHESRTRNQLEEIRQAKEAAQREARRVSALRRKEEIDVKKLDSSWERLKIRMGGKDLARVREVEEYELTQAIAKEEVVQNEIKKLEREERKTNKELQGIMGNKEKLISFQKRRKEMIKQLTKGKETPEMLELEDKIREEEKRLYLLQDDANDIDEGLKHLRKAEEYLSRALSSLGTASAMSVWDMVGGGVLSDIAERSNISDAKNLVGKAQVEIQSASRYLDQVQLPDVHIEMPSLFFDVFFDGLLTDFMAHSKINQAKSRVEQAYRSTRNTINETEGVRRKLQGDVSRSQSVIKSSRVNLENLREEMLAKDRDLGDIDAKSEVDIKIKPPTISFDIPKTALPSETIPKPKLQKTEITKAVPKKMPKKPPTTVIESIPKRIVTETDIIPTSETLDTEEFKKAFNRIKYSFRELITEPDKITGELFSGLPRSITWTPGTVLGEGSVSKKDLTLKLECKTQGQKYDWTEPFKDINVSSPNEQVRASIKGESRIAERIYKLETMKQANISVESNELRIELILTPVTPDSIRTTLDLIRDLTWFIDMASI